ncbi:hypothetical protein CK203_025409 [Vitis vinifera]|uniref:Uncharacterized protein n=1 Tax=Vitis vinifera TaxID=29760 RepID=A0A438IZR4_VITVI|nr:hypothetical protein CK203_025409 [Vitis vinifera]
MTHGGKPLSFFLSLYLPPPPQFPFNLFAYIRSEFFCPCYTFAAIPLVTGCSHVLSKPQSTNFLPEDLFSTRCNCICHWSLSYAFVAVVNWFIAEEFLLYQSASLVLV